MCDWDSSSKCDSYWRCQKKKKEKRQQKQDCEVSRRQGQRTHFMKMYFGKDKGKRKS